MPTNYKRRYSYEAMVPERDAAMRRLSKRPQKISVEGLQEREAKLAAALKALSRYVPPLREGSRADHIAHVRKERRALDRDVFYATVERDAYKIVLHGIEPGAVSLKPPERRHRSPKGLRPAEAIAKLAKLRYRLRGQRSALAQLEYDLTLRLEERKQARAVVDQCAANTHLLRTQHSQTQAERRMLRGPNARAPKGIVASIKASVRAWEEAYAAWQQTHKQVERLRVRIRLKAATVARQEAQLEEWTTAAWTVPGSTM